MNGVPGSVVPLMDWLHEQRRINELQLELMTERFDLDGALAAGQPELAWRARGWLLAHAVRLYLLQRGVSCPPGLDPVDESRRAVDLLATLSPELAEELWQLLLQPAPLATDGMLSAAETATRFVTDRLGVPLLERQDLVRQWADGVRLLREVAGAVGIAKADSWYISAEDPGAQVGWYDEVMATLDGDTEGQRGEVPAPS